MPNPTKSTYFPNSDSEVPSFYDNAFTKLDATYGVKYGIDAAMLTKIETHNIQIPLKIQKAENDKQTAQASTVDKKAEISAARKDLIWVFNHIQNAANFDERDAEDLGMRRTKPPIDLTQVKPVISKVTVLPDKIIFDWVKGEMQGILIESSFDGVTFTKLDKDLKSPYEDTRKNKELNVAETRHFKFRYIYKDEVVGESTDAIKVVCDIY